MFLVEFDKRREYFPHIVGMPSVCRTPADIPIDENLDFKQHILHGKMILKRERNLNPFLKFPSYERCLRRREHFRSHVEQKLNLRVRYGELRSFLTDKYPEARGVRDFVKY